MTSLDTTLSLSSFKDMELALSDLFKRSGLTLRPQQAANWRLCKSPVAGSIPSLGINGTLVATDGILCLLEFGDGTVVDFHLANFKKNPRRTGVGSICPGTASSKQSQFDTSKIEEYTNAYL